MKIDLTDQEVQLILEALNNVNVRGVQSMKMVASLADKLVVARMSQGTAKEMKEKPPEKKPKKK